MIELEKKYIMRGLPDFTAHGYETIGAEAFVQTYLSKTERLRAIENILDLSEGYKYQHFTKEKVGPGKSIETHRDLTEEEYDSYLEHGVRQLEKARMTVRDNTSGMVYEFDEFGFDPPRTRLLLLEVEFQDLFNDMEEVDANFKLPDFIQAEVLADVTGLDSCSNWSLAQEL